MYNGDIRVNTENKSATEFIFSLPIIAINLAAKAEQKSKTEEFVSNLMSAFIEIKDFIEDIERSKISIIDSI